MPSESSVMPFCRQALVGRLWRDVLGEEFIAGMECRGLRRGIAETVVPKGASDANQSSTPGVCRRGP